MPSTQHFLSMATLPAITASSGSNLIAAGTLVYIPLAVAGNANRYTLIHTAPTADWSLRMWVSLDPGGIAIAPQHRVLLPGGAYSIKPTEPAYSHMQRDANGPVFLIDSAVYAVASYDASPGWIVPVIAGSYYLNVQNMVSQDSSFTFAQLGV